MVKHFTKKNCSKSRAVLSCKHRERSWKKGENPAQGRYCISLKRAHFIHWGQVPGKERSSPSTLLCSVLRGLLNFAAVQEASAGELKEGSISQDTCLSPDINLSTLRTLEEGNAS